MNYVPFWTKLASRSDPATSLTLPTFNCCFVATSILYLILVTHLLDLLVFKLFFKLFVTLITANKYVYAIDRNEINK